MQVTVERLHGHLLLEWLSSERLVGSVLEEQAFPFAKCQIALHHGGPCGIHFSVKFPDQRFGQQGSGNKNLVAGAYLQAVVG